MIYSRRAIPEDVDLFRSIRLQALKESPDSFGSTYADAIKREVQLWKEQLLSSVDGVLRNKQFAFSDKVCIGIGALYRQKEAVSGDIIMMWISPKFRGSEAGTLIVDNLLTWAVEIGLTDVQLTVTDTNKRAMAFYEKFGFCPTGDIEDVDKDRGLRGIRMKKRLG